MRINQFLAKAGFGSRRGCEELIRTGRVAINREIVFDLARQILPGDTVQVDGKKTSLPETITLALHKPKNVLCSTTDHPGKKNPRKTVFDLLPPSLPKLNYIGRLDAESEGLILMTNDGDLSQKLSHPRYKINKVYHVHLDKPFDMELKNKLLKGFFIEPGFAKMEKIYPLKDGSLEVTLAQGLNRQIRLMFYKLGYDVKRLKRILIGQLQLGKLKAGESRILNDNEIQETLLGNLEADIRPAGFKPQRKPSSPKKSPPPPPKKNKPRKP